MGHTAAIRTVKMRQTATMLLLAAAATLSACDRSTELRFEGEPEGISTIAALKALCTGDHAAVTGDISVKGVVTGNDLYGEFYKMLVVEDASGGIAIAIDGTELHVDFPVGAAVSVHCNGLVLCDYGGKIELGTLPSDDYAGAGRIPRVELARYLRHDGEQVNPLRPKTLTFGEVGMQHVDTYIHFEGVRFADTGNWCDTDPATGRPVTTERRLEDASGQGFIVRTAATCAYATEPVPQGTGSVYGIIDYFNGKYTLRITNREVDFTTVAARPTTYP